MKRKFYIAIVVWMSLTVAFMAGIILRPAISGYGRRICARVMRLVRGGVRPNLCRSGLYSVMTDAQKRQVDSAIKISFVGDLILLRDAVDFAYDPQSKSYEFDDMFLRAKKYWEGSDLTIGVFEGPMAGGGVAWSTSTFDGDNIPCYLNFPDSFGVACKKAGITLVTTANNHVLDRDEIGAMRTLDMLDAIGLDHTGSYRSKDEYDCVKIVNVCGKRIAVLAYTYGSNYKGDEYFFSPQTRHITRPIVDTRSEFLDENIKLVENDFRKAKSASPDLIIVLPHMGEQHRHTPDQNQRFWCDVFVRNGANLILADHPHNVQPIEWRTFNNKQVLIVYCPGNFTNSFTYWDNDGSMIVQVYLDRASACPIAASIVPLYAYGEPGGSYVGLPICEVVSDPVLAKTMSRGEQKRAAKVQRFVTSVATGTEVPIENAQDRYFIFPDIGYVRQPVAPIDLTKYSGSPFLKELQRAKSICFVGDSVTEGTMNGGYGWYEPISEALRDKSIMRFALGSMTSKYFTSHRQEIARSDLYVFAYGCNDIRYRDAKTCAMNSDEFINNIANLVGCISREKPEARFAFIAPWRSHYNDKNWHGTLAQKSQVYNEYSCALSKYCHKNGFLFIDPNPYIERILSETGHDGRYMVDYIHPGATLGIRLYSESVLACGKVNF